MIDPWAGSYMMEKLTQDMADAAWTIIEEVEAMGGMTKRGRLAAGPSCKIEASAAEKQARIDSGKDVIVGVNKYRLAKEDAHEIREVDNVHGARAADRAAASRSAPQRDSAKVQAALDALTAAAENGAGQPAGPEHPGGAPARHRGRGQRCAGERSSGATAPTRRR